MTKYTAGLRLTLRARDAELKSLGAKFNQTLSIVDDIPQSLLEMLDKGSVPCLVNATKSDTQEGELIRVTDYDLSINSVIIQRGQSSNADGSNSIPTTKAIRGDLFLHFSVIDLYQLQETLLKLELGYDQKNAPASVSNQGLVRVPYSDPSQNQNMVVPVYGKAHEAIYKALFGVNTSANISETLTEQETVRLSNFLYFMDKIMGDRLLVDKLIA
jgi:hypothetical protein